MPDLAALVEGVTAGKVRAVARALTVIETGGAAAEALLAALPPGDRLARRVGITGGFGSGKSTLVEGLGVHLLERGERAAVLAVDPSSPFTGGALLGDRVRMTRFAAQGGYVRSMATRGMLGGLSAATEDAISVLEAAGFAWIIVETVGVGQDEVEVAGEVDSVVVLLPPGSGDEIQTAKAGLLEIADVFAVNKADQPGADAVVAALDSMLVLAPPGEWRPPVLRTVARSGEGVPELVDALLAHGEFLARSGRRDGLRRARRVRRLERAVTSLLLAELREEWAARWETVSAAVGDGRLDVCTGARQLLAAVRGGHDDNA